jgi:hypothetical protein
VCLVRRLRRVLAATLLLGASAFARGQTANTNIYYSNIAWTSSYVSGQQVLVPIPNAQITVCTYPANAVPCTNLATLYYGPTVGGGMSPTNPVSGDQYGNFSFWAASGYYQYTVTNSYGQSAGPYTIVLGGTGSGGGSASIPATTFVLKGSNTLGTALAAIPGTDYVIPSGSISGTAANLSGAPDLPNGTTATTQSPGDSTLNLATDAFVAAVATASIPATTSLLAGSGTAGAAAAVTAIPNGTTATTQSVADNTTKVATDAFVLANLNNIAAPITIYSAAGTALPSCVGGLTGAIAVVSDATTPTFLTTYTPSGTVVSPVICNGTNWVTY